MRRCSLLETHLAHGYSDGERCDGGQPQPAPQIRYVVPLDGHGRRGYVWLPEDLTAVEADRLARMLATLPLPEERG